MKKVFVILILLFLPGLAHAEEGKIERPHWSLEVKGGMFYPDIDDWKAYYGSDHMPYFAASIAYKLLRQVELGVEGGYAWDDGKGLAPLHSEKTGTTVTAGEVNYQLAPVQAFVLLRGVFSEEQWLVPYAGGGWTRMYYKERIKDQGTVRGATNGYHGRAGLQFLLDGLDTSAANSFYMDFGVHHTYVFVEAEYIKAKKDTVDGNSVNLGGTSYLVGLLFEF